MRLLLGALALSLLVVPAAGHGQEKKAKYRMLFITQSKGFTHGSVKRKSAEELAPSEVSVTDIGKTSGLFDVECTQDASVLTPEKLKELDAVMFYTTGALPISKENFAAFEQWLQSGKAMIGAHSATDTFGSFKPYFSLINGTFDGHPWGAGETVTCTVHEPGHAVAKPWEPEFQIKDEIYQYRNYDPKTVRVIYSLNMAKCRTKMPYHVPVCWVREVLPPGAPASPSGSPAPGPMAGRLFYTNLGHNEGTWTNPKFKEHLLAGIRWALKLEDGPATPNPEVQYGEQAKAFAAVLAAENGKNADELAARAEKGAKSDPAWGEKIYADIAAYRRLDKKKDPEKAKAEVVRILGEIEKK